MKFIKVLTYWKIAIVDNIQVKRRSSNQIRFRFLNIIRLVKLSLVVYKLNRHFGWWNYVLYQTIYLNTWDKFNDVEGWYKDIRCYSSFQRNKFCLFCWNLSSFFLFLSFSFLDNDKRFIALICLFTALYGTVSFCIMVRLLVRKRIHFRHRRWPFMLKLAILESC